MLNQVSGALTHDFCPWANRYVYWLKRPIGWVFLAFLSSILLGIYVSPQAFLATAGIAMVAIIGSLWPWISMLGVRGELSWNALRCEELESIETDLVVTFAGCSVGDGGCALLSGDLDHTLGNEWAGDAGS